MKRPVVRAAFPSGDGFGPTPLDHPEGADLPVEVLAADPQEDPSPLLSFERQHRASRVR